MCAELDALIDEGKAPVGALHPKSLPGEGLYSLDVDSPIWDDSGLNDVDSGDVPPWLGDNEVREGITAWLTVQRCDEELARLKIECARLRRWAKSEWEGLESAAALLGGHSRHILRFLKLTCFVMQPIRVCAFTSSVKWPRFES